MHKSSVPRTPYAWLHSLAGLCGLCGHSKLFKMNSSSHLLVAEFPQMTVLNLVLGGTIFTEGGHYSLVTFLGGTLYTMTTAQKRWRDRARTCCRDFGTKERESEEKEVMLGMLLKLLVKEKLLHSGKVPVNVELRPLRREKQGMEV